MINIFKLVSVNGLMIVFIIKLGVYLKFFYCLDILVCF